MADLKFIGNGWQNKEWCINGFINKQDFLQFLEQHCTTDKQGNEGLKFSLRMNKKQDNPAIKKWYMIVDEYEPKQQDEPPQSLPPQPDDDDEVPF